MSIFISIASFCDPWLRFTVESLLSQAEQPEKLGLAVVDQSRDDHRSWLSNLPWRRQIRYVQLDPMDSRGVAWARNIAFSLYDGEDYLLQIDSHSYFEPGWDRKLTEQIQRLQQHTEKPLITTYPPAFAFDEDGQPQRTSPPHDHLIVLRPHPESDLTEESATLRFRAEYVKGPKFVEGYHLAAGFLFTRGLFVLEIPYDPFLYFHGEEQDLALRAYTRGWTIFHPRHRDIPLLHLYKKKGEEHRSHHWNQEHESKRVTRWVELQKRSDERIRQLLMGGGLPGVYGLGAERTLDQYALASGIDYVNRRIRR